MGTPTQYLCDYWSGWVRLPRFVCGPALILVLQPVGPLGEVKKNSWVIDSRLRSIPSGILFEVLLELEAAAFFSIQSGGLLAGIHGLFSRRYCGLDRRVTYGYPWPGLEGNHRDFGMIQERFRSSA
ncbi:hypothetical protein Tco_0893454 [Tanacetum coccineum]|uniref:Uncharacterized protein n=1 Tax=Tanacetum coccineum TaxID=301880 RepID=A0ABQ5CBP2_9ASTR